MTWRICYMERRDDVDWSMFVTDVLAVLIYLATISGCDAIDIGL